MVRMGLAKRDEVASLSRELEPARCPTTDRFLDRYADLVVSPPFELERYSLLSRSMHACEPFAADGDLAQIRSLVRTGRFLRLRDLDDPALWPPPEAGKPRLEPRRYQELVGNFRAIPRLQIGDWMSYDRFEIESARQIMETIVNYIRHPEDKFPLGICVFGSPGSGKTFFVSELIKAINDERSSRPGKPAIEKHEVNLSQFGTESDLIPEMDRIRDITALGKIPLVLWDEFDSTVGQEPYFWPKRFLDPLQRGKYRRSTGEGEIGRAIFVFAGGINSSVDAFRTVVKEDHISSVSSTKTGPHGPRKLMDFASRIRIMFDALGLELEAHDAIPDVGYKIRRAIVLRTTLLRAWAHLEKEINGQKRIDIEDDVIDNFLNRKSYTYGVRSLVTLVNSANLVGESSFTMASLPPSKVWEQHAPQLESAKRT